jgi:hypothetical protein
MASVLRAHPELAARVGVFFAEFAGLEWEIDHSFGALLGDRPELAEAFFRPRENIAGRFDAVLRFVEALRSADPVAACFLKVEADLKEIIAFRNALAHGAYEAAAEPDAVSLTLGKRRRLLTVEALDARLRDIENVKLDFDLARKRRREIRSEE